MRMIKYIGVVLIGIGIIVTLGCAGEPSPRFHISTWGSLGWVYAGVGAVLLGALTCWIYEFAEWWRRETRLRQRQDRRRSQ